MGIINITPDSFSGDGLLIPRPKNSNKNFTAQAVRLANRLIREGADIIDLGGESTRPGARPISAAEEIRRIIPAVKILARTSSIPISVDTYKSAVAKEALEAGAHIINLIQGVRPEKTLLKMIARYEAAIVLMHIRGTPQTMQRRIHYRDVIDDIRKELKKSVEICLEMGIKSDRIIIDPGIGFGKTVEHNLEILNRLAEFQNLKCPILIGTSRKSFIGKVLNEKPGQRLLGTAATVAAAVFNGAHIVRVHDVKAARQISQMTDAILHPENYSQIS